MNKALLWMTLLLLFSKASREQDADSSHHIDSQFVKANDTLQVLNTQSVSIDSVPVQNRHLVDAKYGTLLNDDPIYNPKYPWWRPAARVVSANVINWALDRYVFNYEWSRISPATWKYNIQKGWEWDNDRFGINFIGHPYSGSYYFNIARSSGYNFWQSFPYAVGGSLMWEYFGENTRPSINDIINTPVSGAFLGEIMYRVSSNILNDRSRGSERFFRELLAALVNPPRAYGRLAQGKMFRVTPYEVYQKEPMNITFYAGVHRINNKEESNNKFGSGTTNAVAQMQIDYGDPFEVRDRKPYDIFRGRIELQYGSNKYLINTINGYGLITGKTNQSERLLHGLFQHFDYWHNDIFEVGALAFGYGLLSKIPSGSQSALYSNIHVGLMPLAGNNTQYGPDTSNYRFYNFGGGLEGKIEETMNIGNRVNLGFSSFFYWIHTYNGVPGNSLVEILKPTIAMELVKNVSLGFEHQIYRNDRFSNKFQTLHLVRTEQKLYLQFFFGNHKRDDDYH